MENKKKDMKKMDGNIYETLRKKYGKRETDWEVVCEREREKRKRQLL